MIDFHVHFFPERVFRRIWEVFDTTYWPVKYHLHGAELVECLKEKGVERFTTLVYAHKPGMAEGLNEFVAEWAAREPALIPFGTVYSGDESPVATARRCFEEYGFIGLKLQPAVSREMVDDPRLFPVYEQMEAQGRIVLAHAGSGPQGWMQEGHERVRRVLEQFPNLTFVAAHCGAAEFSEFSALAEEYPKLYFDTAMISVPCEQFPGNCPGREFYLRHADRILFGSDFPNIPYAYEVQIEGVRGLGLGAEVEEKIFRENAIRLLGVA